MQQRSLVRGEAESTYRRVVAVEPANLHTIAVGGDFLMAKIQLSGIMRHLGRPDHRVEYLAGSVHLDLLTGGLREDERTVKNIRGWIDEYIVKNRVRIRCRITPTWFMRAHSFFTNQTAQIPDRLPGYGHRALNPEQKKQYNAEPEKDNNFELAVVCVTVSALLLPALAIPFILSPYATEEELAELRRLAACHS